MKTVACVSTEAWRDAMWHTWSRVITHVNVKHSDETAVQPWRNVLHVNPPPAGQPQDYFNRAAWRGSQMVENGIAEGLNSDIRNMYVLKI